MITADLHGHRRTSTPIQRIADLENNPRRHLVMQEVCHGGPTYPGNGGCMSHTMLEDVARLKTEYPQRVHFLLSNHELAGADGLSDPQGQKMLNLMFRMGMQEAYGAAADKVRDGVSATSSAAARWRCGCRAACCLPHRARADAVPPLRDRRSWTGLCKPPIFRSTATCSTCCGAATTGGECPRFARPAGPAS